jgi:hypothetical protein
MVPSISRRLTQPHLIDSILVPTKFSSIPDILAQLSQLVDRQFVQRGDMFGTIGGGHSDSCDNRKRSFRRPPIQPHTHPFSRM